jgi:hypothetical protein
MKLQVIVAADTDGWDSYSEKETAGWQQHGVNSIGSGGWTVPNRRISLTTVPSTRVCGPNRSACWREVACWSTTESQMTAKIVLSQSRWREKAILGEFHGRSLGGYLDLNKTLDIVRQQYYHLYTSSSVERLCQQCKTCATGRGTWSPGQMHQCNVEAPFMRTVTKVGLRGVTPAGGVMETGMRGYQSSHWPTEHQPMILQVRHLSAWCSGGSYTCPVTCCLQFPIQQNTHQYLKLANDRIKASYDHLANSTESRKVTMSGCTICPGPEEYHLSCRLPGKALTGWSPGSTM